MNIVIISGGSGNDKLIKGLKSFYPECNIKVIVNAYDNGKSTGICRKVTSTLGVSDIRKNHIRMYKATKENIDNRLVEFYENRYNFTKGNEVEEISNLLIKWDLSPFIDYVKRFFNRSLANSYYYNDFNVSNIVYSEMYAEIGYSKTNKYFCDLLGIDDFVLLNSDDNVYIHAVTKNDNVIDDEGKIVEYKNSSDKIVDIKYIGYATSLNSSAISAVKNADLIVISTGTFWSSIYPTLQYLDFYKHINNSNAKKIWAINNEEDKDAYGVTSNDFINIVKNLGLDLDDFMILENTDARESLQLVNCDVNIVRFKMGNDSGKHDGLLYAKAILKIYFNLININYEKILFDFDDTIWSRNSEDIECSKRNIYNLNKLLGNNATIISGNSYKSIATKLYSVFGTDLKDFVVDVWADANSTLYRMGRQVDLIKDLTINSKEIDLVVDELKCKYDLSAVPVNESGSLRDDFACLKIKPLSNLERLLLVSIINDTLKHKYNASNIEAILAGKTTVDIVNSKNNKSVIFNHLKLNGLITLYIGDEIDFGNDRDIAKECNNAIFVKSVYDTEAVIKLLGEEYENRTNSCSR